MSDVQELSMLRPVVHVMLLSAVRLLSSAGNCHGVVIQQAC